MSSFARCLTPAIYCVHSLFDDAQYFAIYCARPSRPATRNAKFEDPGAALHYMLTNQDFRDTKLWYNGYEEMRETRDANGILEAVNGYYDKDRLLSIAQRLGLNARQACEAIWALPLQR